MNNTTTCIPTNCSAWGMSLENNSAYRICQTCRERAAVSRRRRRAGEQQEDALVATNPRGSQEEQVSLLMLKVEPEADPGQTLLSIPRSFLAFVLWTLDAWTRNDLISMPYTRLMKGKRNLR
ncbi:hypothetical protein G6F70_000186 [Rhizopus microsporus]|nr:hypothetical protein G6F71_001466 [Rhizopus microsporus]KAG1204734.1 hypothetical protein G6F70_000186 [Rhizopus microsporus]KAG1216097.1 hypothetical protein G6F69_000417 [Rhizopus microsporus]KAG1237067.1 hypothetical protein G6F67_001485 [Rhizopus microsporus]KAG1269680.1 hypothetical protein G6F68_000098 [Rhizopus microsporus]